MGVVLTKIKNVLCSCCSNGFSCHSRCCSKDTLFNMDVEIPENNQPDTDIQLNCFGLKFRRSSHTPNTIPNKKDIII